MRVFVIGLVAALLVGCGGGQSSVLGPQRSSTASSAGARVALAANPTADRLAVGQGRVPGGVLAADIVAQRQRSTQLVLRSMVTGKGPVISLRATLRGGSVCMRSDTGLLARAGGTVDPCVGLANLADEDGLQGSLYRIAKSSRRGGEIVLVGVADPARIGAVRVRRHGWPSRALVTLPVSSVGAFALVEPGMFREGITYELRPVYRTAHVAVMRPLGLGSVLGGKPARRFSPSLYAHYSVMRRARRPSDVMSGVRRLGAPGEFDANPSESRLVARSGGLRAWLVPGRRSICTVLSVPTAHGSGGAVSCTDASLRGLYDGSEPTGQSMLISGRPGRRLVTFLLLPDGTHDVQLQSPGADAQTLRRSLNGVIGYARPGWSYTWIADDGTRHQLP